MKYKAVGTLKYTHKHEESLPGDLSDALGHAADMIVSGRFRVVWILRNFRDHADADAEITGKWYQDRIVR